MSLTPKLLQQGAAGSAKANYIEEVFSTYLYAGNSASQTITNDIDLAGKGGLVWIKNRTNDTQHVLTDTAQGAGKYLSSNSTASTTTNSFGVTSFTSSGFGISSADGQVNFSPNNYASWTFRKQPKFFDIVTWSGDDTTSRVLNHNLGSPPGVIMIKGLNDSYNWDVLYRLNGNDTGTFSGKLSLSGTGNDIGARGASRTATTFQLNNEGVVGPNVSGKNYIAYLFAHNAGGFGLTGNDNVISCGSYTGNGSATGPIVTLGYEPQWLMIKRTSGTENGNWVMLDVMRGFNTSTDNDLYANLSSTEGTGLDLAEPQATGFQIKSGSSGVNANGDTYIYIAIRRGPMKVPTTGTSVFAPTTYVTNGAASRKISTSPSFPVDLAFFNERSRTGYTGTWVNDKLRGLTRVTYIFNPQYAEESYIYGFEAFNNDGVVLNGSGYNSISTSGVVLWLFGRAPGFFDEVCYTGSGSTSAVTHNLKVQPELIIYKARSNADDWIVHTPDLISQSKFLRLNSTDAAALNSTQGYTNSGTPTSTTITPGDYKLNTSSWTYVAYLFASCPGVSKVGTYTGNGSTQTINCGFAAGARFVLIKRTDNTGSWYTFDTARGIVSGNDPYLLLNNTTAESSSYDAVDPDNSGFIVNNDATNYPINVASATYIFLAIA